MQLICRRTHATSSNNSSTVLVLLLVQVNFDIEVQEEEEDHTIQQRIENPSTDSITSALHKVQEQNTDVEGQVATEHDDLAVQHEGEAGARQAYGGPEPVAVDHGVDQGDGEDGQHLEGLRELEPEEGHKRHEGVVEELEQGQATTSQDGEEGAQHVEEAGEVVHVRPEEDPTRRPGAQWEAEQPLERGLGPPPEPAGLVDLGGGGQEDSGEDGGGDDGHAEAVDGGNGSERDGSTRAAEEGEEEAEDDGEEEVEGDGGEQEGPGGAPRLGVAPTEGDNGRVLGEPEGQDLGHR